MAIPPNIPTSFVPKQAIQASGVRALRRHGANPINIVAPGILLISVLAAGGVYGYERYLTDKKEVAAAELLAQEQHIDQDGVREFIRLRDRLATGNKLLSEHVTLSTFFSKLEKITLQNVRFDSLTLAVAADRGAEIKMSGRARGFNALAAQSTKFSSDPLIRRAIFSGVNQNADGTVDFSVSAEIVSGLVTGGAVTAPPSSILPAATATTTPEVATTTPATSTATATTTPTAATPSSATSTVPAPTAPSAPTQPVVPTASATTTP